MKCNEKSWHVAIYVCFYADMQPDNHDPARRDLSFLQSLFLIAKEAGRLIMEVRSGGLEVEYKDDHSPVTEADTLASAYIVKQLQIMFPDIPVVSEEAVRDVDVEARFWLVDPLDGTKGFIRGEDEFTVNIGLIEGKHPVAGIIYLPAKDEGFFGSDATGAFQISGDSDPQPIHTERREKGSRAVVLSKHHPSPNTQAMLDEFGVATVVHASSSYKFCQVANGNADLYPRAGRTMEWDTAAGHAIVEAAGGRMTTLEGEPFRYGKPDYANGGFIVEA